MIQTNTITDTRERLQEFRRQGSIGFVPTMGALHQGHLSLVEKAAAENSIVAVSIFVNPTQFNNPEDLKRYPRNLASDLELLKDSGCHLVFAPGEKEIYPEPDIRRFDFGHLDQIMEGKHRPGHFNGVAQVVSKLFDIVKPDRAYFGIKDFQQLAVIKKMTKILHLPVEIIPCPIIREKNGLAMSSRNELLLPEERENASLIYKTLANARNLTGNKSVQELKNWIQETINQNPFLLVEYIEIVDIENLLPISSWNEKGGKIACIAVRCGKVRLIDNIILN
ncbi:MAG: pantoate--beta-alanine ligase [Mariniphaga sp.]|nr:pantoate--beta-alanine ligase [Mariniphaga sp.]MDD4225407.1 pantoate--beta-alanine ligase [Mariniphaga sp.]